MNDYGLNSNKDYRDNLVVINKFSKIGWTTPLKNKYAQSKTDICSQIVKTSKRKPNLLESDDSMEYVNKIFNDFLNNNNFKTCSRYISKGEVFAEKLNRTRRKLLKTPVFEKGNADWVSELPITIKQSNITIQPFITQLN